MDFAASEALYLKGLQQLAESPEVAKLGGCRVCVIGCTGLIGTVLTSILAAANENVLESNPTQVYGVARRASAHFPNQSQFKFIPASVTDSDASSLLPPCDYYIYIAGTTSDYLTRAVNTIETQTVGLARFLFGSHQGSAFVYVSSTRVYGRLDSDIAVGEDHVAMVRPMHLDNIYDSSKRLGESLCCQFARNQSVRATVVRLSNIYGPAGSLQADTVVSNFVQQAFKTRRILLTGQPNSIRNHCSVLDAVQGILKALVWGRTAQAYNIASSEHLTTNRLAELISGTLPFPVKIGLPQIEDEPSIQRVSIAKATSELDFVPKYRFRQLAPFIVTQIAKTHGLL